MPLAESSLRRARLLDLLVGEQRREDVGGQIVGAPGQS